VNAGFLRENSTMLTRRKLIEMATGGAATAAIERVGFAKDGDRPLGVQLYTVRSVIENNLPGTLAAIRKIGYRTVETYGGQYKTAATDLCHAIRDSGLTAPSGHFSYSDLDSYFDYAKELGLEYMVCSMIPTTVANSSGSYKRAADQFNEWGEQARKMGMRFAFHNHDMEFKDYGGVTGFDVLMQNTDPALVEWQMDCYWVAQAGRNPIEMLRKYGRRMPSLHLKDRKPNVPTSYDTGPASAHFTEVGTGTLDWVTILALAAKDHITDMYVEQDQTELPPLESLRISYTNLVKILNA
jgi:sugar phosphate isomerase/epimerase